MSDALELAKYYKNKVKSLRLLDHVVTDTEINQQGFKTDKKSSSFKKYDAILILNNHPKNTNFNLSDKLKTDGIVFDGWKQLSKYSIEESGFYYSTMGYLPQKRIILKNISYIVCDNGLGHVRRSYLITSKWKF